MGWRAGLLAQQLAQLRPLLDTELARSGRLKFFILGRRLGPLALLGQHVAAQLGTLVRSKLACGQLHHPRRGHPCSAVGECRAQRAAKAQGEEDSEHGCFLTLEVSPLLTLQAA